MNTDKLLSVVIPTYNMEALLPRCLSNLIINDETLFNMLEVLVVIDGATDGSSVIAHQYEQEHPQVFRVIDKENGNYGSCVNRGLAEAKGKYIKVLDADDYFDSQSLNTLIELLQNNDTDLVLTNYCTCDIDGKNIVRKSFDIPTNTELSTKELSVLGAHMAMHAVTYKTEKLRNIGYKQTEGISYTDQEWIYKPMTTVKTFIYHNLDLYYYTIGRIGQTMDIEAMAKNMHHNIIVLRSVLNTYINTNKDDDIYEYLRNRIEKFAEYIYSLYLFNTEKINIAPLITFDKELSSTCPKLYNFLGKLYAGKLPFVKIWRLFYYKKDYGINNFFRYRKYRLFLPKTK